MSPPPVIGEATTCDSLGLQSEVTKITNTQSPGATTGGLGRVLGIEPLSSTLRFCLSRFRRFPMPSTHHGILIHVVFSTKQRFKLLHKDWRDDLFGYMGGIAEKHKSIALRSGGMEDHVHLLLKIHPGFAISDTVKLIKGNSSKWINENRKINARFEWQRGYGAFSVSESMSDTVKHYIEHQEEHHHETSFEDEYISFLKKHKIEYDPRYVFDDEHVG